jgi:predicted small secreted protein
MEYFMKSVTQILLVLLSIVLSACASYTTPGRGVNIQNLSAADSSIADLLKTQPAAPFPARMAVVRVQASGYYSHSSQCHGEGQFCVVTTRDVESEASFQRLGNLPQVAGIAVMNRLLLPAEKLTSTMDLRRVAAMLKTDLLLIYTLDTGFNVESTDIGPLQVISLGFLPTKNAVVRSTASAAIFDVRTGFIYGVAEATATEEQRASSWSSSSAVDAARRTAEKNAFDKLIPDIEKLWKNILATHTRSAH